MNGRRSGSGLDRAATEWVVRLTSGTVQDEDIVAARAWCEQSSDHRAAFERAREFWQAAAVPTGVAATVARPRAAMFAIAASALLAVGVSLAAWNGQWTADYRTQSEQQRITLEDGSSVLLDAGTALDVEYSAASRSVHLRTGQALFQVAHQPNRPFVVHARDLSATAVGTVYSVREQPDSAEVIVSEGTVLVAGPEGESLLVHAGEHVIKGEGLRLGEPARTNSGNALAWQRGLLVFEQAPLEQVVAEINRHRSGYIVIAKPQLRSRVVSGVLQMNDLDGGLNTLSSAFDVRITSITSQLLVLH